MTNIDLEFLPYPMFTTTEGEKYYLKVVSPLLTAKDCDYYLCCALEGVFGTDTVHLVEKVQSSLRGYLSLVSYLGVFDITEDAKAELRRIWICKLLEYTGE